MSIETRPPEEEEELEPDRPERRLPGIVYPLVGLIFGTVLVFSFSRILLAVSKTQAAAIALLVALCILVGAALVAYGNRVRRRPVAFPFIVAAGLVVVAAGIVAMGIQPEEEGPPQGGGGGGGAETVSLVASQLAFDTSELTLTSGSKVSLRFENKDSGVPHNFAMFQGPDENGPVIFRGELVTGPNSATYSFVAPPPGDYYFHCDVHPNMNGTVSVKPGGEGGGEPGGEEGGGQPGGPPGTLDLTAKNISFDTKELHAPPGGSITIHFTNEDAVPHNVVVFDGGDATAEPLFRGDLLTGPGTSADYTFEAPPPGSYFFHCDVHPTQMTGTLEVK